MATDGGRRWRRQPAYTDPSVVRSVAQTPSPTPNVLLEALSIVDPSSTPTRRGRQEVPQG
jgi:hypothetical protein